MLLEGIFFVALSFLTREILSFDRWEIFHLAEYSSSGLHVVADIYGIIFLFRQDCFCRSNVTIVAQPGTIPAASSERFSAIGIAVDISQKHLPSENDASLFLG